MDAIDAQPTTSSPIQEKIHVFNKPIIPAKNEDLYNMGHKNRGLVLILNHCADNQPRLGTEKDCEIIKETFERLKFQTMIQEYNQYQDLEQHLKIVANMDHTENDCLVVVVLTYGDLEKMHARGESYSFETLWKPFVANKCPTLAGKPKMFFIQADKDYATDEIDVGPRIEFDGMESRKRTKTIKIPTMADFLFMYTGQGSTFMQILCEEISKHAEEHDLQSILTFVNNRLTLNSNKNVKQFGTIVHSLTRLIHFYR